MRREIGWEDVWIPEDVILMECPRSVVTLLDCSQTLQQACVKVRNCISVALIPGDRDGLWKTQITECYQWRKILPKSISLWGEENERVARIDTVRSHDGPIFNSLFIDWWAIMMVEHALSELRGSPTRSEEEIILSPSLQKLGRDKRTYCGKNDQTSLRIVLFQKCNHPSIHSFIHQARRIYST